MEDSKRIPLLTGLIGRRSGSIHCQLEVSLVNYDTIHVAIKRKAFCGLPDIEFTMPDVDLQEFVEVFGEAKRKADNQYCASRAEAQKGTRKEPSKDERKPSAEDKISLLKQKYSKKGYTNPESVLEKKILEKMNQGKTAEQAIDELYVEEKSSA